MRKKIPPSFSITFIEHQMPREQIAENLIWPLNNFLKDKLKYLGSIFTEMMRKLMRM